jgi:2-methylisocitrate lyase-like PEP mutase family enzyme
MDSQTSLEGSRKPRAQLRSLIRRRSTVAAGCFDTLSAFLAERVGFEALHVTGFGVEASMLAGPDMGLVTATELAAHVDRITSAVKVPVICDVDAGFGGIENIYRTILLMERAGIAAIHIEDADMPKRNPFIDGRTVFSRATAVGRIQAACAARSDPDFVIIARSDADEISVDELVTRCNLYLEAGADMAMPIISKVDGSRIQELSSEEQLSVHRSVVERIKGPVFGVAIPAGYHAQDMLQAGYALMALPMLTLMPAVRAMWTSLEKAREEIMPRNASPYLKGSLDSVFDLLQMLGLNEYIERQNRFYRR